MSFLLIDGVQYDVPEEEDFELGELAELSRLRDEFGEIGSTIALVWIAKHRKDSSFTVEDAKRVKVGNLVEKETAAPDPLPDVSRQESAPTGDANLSETGPSATHEDTGIQS